MSWLNFNDSLNNLKGQISNFANNVLAEEDEGTGIKDNDYKQLQELCHRQELEIQKLRKVNEELNNPQNTPDNASRSNGTWNWDANEESLAKFPSESISDLKNQILLLENEKSELLGQLDQLDADNQENLTNIMKMKEKLQYELNDVNENYLRIKKENEILLEREHHLKKEVEDLKLIAETDISTDNNKEYAQKCKDLAEINQKVNGELVELKKELDVIKSSNDTLQKILEDTKKAETTTVTENEQKLINENKLLYSELKKANEKIIQFEKKSLEDEETCHKLSIILETYETQVSILKQDTVDLLKKYEDVQTKLEESDKSCNYLLTEKENHDKQLNALIEELENLKAKANNATNLSLATELNTEKEETEKLRQENAHLIESNAATASFVKQLEETIKNQQQELEATKTDNESLKQLNEDLLVKANGRMDRDLESELEDIQNNHEQQLNMLREELEHLKDSESKSSSQEKKINELEEEKLVLSRELQDVREELEAAKTDNESLKQLNEDLLVKANGRMDRDLESELEDIQNDHEQQLNMLREELEHLKDSESKSSNQEKKINELEEEKLVLSRELQDIREELEEIKQNHEVSLNSLHNKYIGIITNNIKKFQECEKPSDFQHQVDENDPQAVELIKHVEDIMKILLDLKCKSRDLEKRVLDISEEKNTISVEKNKEIEKLIKNSDLLSQEILSKTQAIKDYENECNELAKNNELLITELEALKNNPGLQTISESNEDSMILLESQLENANKRIEDLEKLVDDLENNQMRKDSLESTNAELENAMKQLSITENEIDNKKRDYQELLNNFDELQVEYESLKNELKNIKEKLILSTEENLELKTNIDKLKTDYENTEYQLSEINVNSETIKEEMDEYKNKYKLIMSEHSNLKLQNEENLRKYLDFESKVNSLEEQLLTEESNRKELETQIEVITEKLKSSKMAETSLKLQYEQKSKELAAQSEERYNLEISLNKINADLAEFQNNFIEIQDQNDKLLTQQAELKEEILKKDKNIIELQQLVKQLEETSSKNVASLSITKPIEEEVELSKSSSEKPANEDQHNLKIILDQTVLEKANLQAELNKLSQVQTQLKETTEKFNLLHQQLQEVTNSRNELINMVTMKHQENVTYHNEIQKLNQLLTAEAEKYKNLEKQLQSTASNADIEAKNQQIDKLTDQNNFLKEKCEIIAKNLLEEQSKTQQMMAERAVPSEKETTLQKNLDRLQAHLIELEEHYTEELLQAEQKNATLKAKVADIEEREKSSSTMYTSVSIRANQQVESLQSQLQTVIAERDVLRKHISDAEDENSKQAAALANLQFVLEQFRKDKENDVLRETERIRRQINAEKQVQDELRKEIANLNAQLEERNQGLLAASRLSDQLESSKKTILGLKDEVSQLQTKLSKTEGELNDALSSTDGKVDKSLIKNLILGFVTTNNNMNRDQSQILKIIATVLDFNQQDHEKVKLNKPQQGWLASFLAPNPDKMSEESLSRAFIRFLENESRPRLIPSLLDDSTIPSSNSSTKSSSSASATPKQTPIVLSEIVLPTFPDFAQNRNSSSILKDVLKDNS